MNSEVDKDIPKFRNDDKNNFCQIESLHWEIMRKSWGQPRLSRTKKHYWKFSGKGLA